MALLCPACKSDNVQTLVRGIQCLERRCGQMTSFKKLNETESSRED